MSQHRSTTAPQHHNTATPQHHSTTAPQYQSTRAPEHQSTRAPQHQNATAVLDEPFLPCSTCCLEPSSSMCAAALVHDPALRICNITC